MKKENYTKCGYKQALGNCSFLIQHGNNFNIHRTLSVNSIYNYRELVH